MQGDIEFGPRQDVFTARELLQVEERVGEGDQTADLGVDRAQGQRTPVELARFLADASAPYRTAAERDGRTIKVVCDPATVDVDPRWLEPAVGTLLDNALRHGTGTILLRAVSRGGRLRLSVSDEGPGFPPDFLTHAFDRFTRAESSRTTPGTGLGLALVAAVAASHEGTARAENTSPGAVVTLDITC
ncbi:sensor histidine kinase [Streptomyces durhamensis]|uniref:sensor histidine kinase n=1 Tax=Streptomyces durhamensis TaxID=68194 RepID=UPI0004CD8832|nr:HAMP domain-containing sensor histidine kinase [Streptomyces durhamensis]